ncbi:MAG: dihydroorotase [Oscillospiraceae bacterium]|jgi:dihydroorotase
MSGFTIKNALVYVDGALKKTDVIVNKGVIAAIGTGLERWGSVIDAGGLILSPGFIDLHVHLREPGYEHKETIASGTYAAAAGGYTTVCAMPNLSPVPDSLEALEAEKQIIKRDARIRVFPYGAITLGQRGEKLADMKAMSNLVCGYSDDGRGVQSESLMREAMETAAAEGLMIASHCEDESREDDREKEYFEVQRDIRLSAETSCPLHICHASTLESFNAVRRAKDEGLSVTCEVTPHHALLCKEDIDFLDGRYVMNPPLRSREDMQAAVEALIDGTADAVATDHAPHSLEEKAAGANGVIGLETAFAVLHTKLVLTGKLPMTRLLELLTTGPASVLALPYGIKRGVSADLALIDPNLEWVIGSSKFLSKGRSTPFEGWKVKGRVVATFLNGEKVYNDAGLL